MSGIYTIPLSGLKEGRHLFEFEIEKEFFEGFEESEIKEGSLKAYVEMEKRSSHLDMVISISGTVNIICDRCLDEFPWPLDCRNRLLVKSGKSISDDDPDILSISSDEHELDLRQHLYEYIHLALPIKRVHPEDKSGKSTCNPDMLKKLKEMLVDDENEETIDPRWDDLKKLMNN